MELKDPPFEVAEAVCPACALLEDHTENAPKGDQRRLGTHPYFRYIDEE